MIHQHRLRSCLCVRRNMAARGPAENGGATNLHCLSSDERQKKKRKNNTENRKTGQDADICKRSDTDLEKASSSGWLVNRGVKLPCGSQSMGEISSPLTQPVHFCCQCLLLVEAWRLLEFFLYVLLSIHIFSQWGGVNPFGFGVMKTEHNCSLFWGYSVVTKLRPWLSWRVPNYPSCFFAVSRCSSWKPLWRHNENFKTIMFCKCFAFIEPEMHFCIKL